MSGTLYVVATPIGNLEDITLRALRILKEVDVILCEDTQTTKKLLSHYDIHTPVDSFHAHSEDAKLLRYIERLQKGESIAYVTDAGTPGISDPGSRLVREVRSDALDVEIIPIPGASALTVALSVAGIERTEFVFLGFPPHKKGRKTFFESVVDSDMPVVFYESPHRILKSLESLSEVAPDRSIVIARELTKIHEEIREGTAAELLSYYTENPDKCRGEFVVLCEAK
jgi:16S rRNA (cytidine1402-2'-O)-methyltransferase